MTANTNLRDRYFNGEIFQIGEIVECVKTGTPMKIIDRGANYVTVVCEGNISKKWLNDIKEIVPQNTVAISENSGAQTEDTVAIPEVIVEEFDKDFTLTESGQIQLFGYETKNFDFDISEIVLEQFQEFDDMYSKHQIIKCLDMAIMESDADRAYDLLNRVETFYANQNMESPLIVEIVKTELERKRILEVLATIAGIKVGSTVGRTVFDAVKALKEQYKTRAQWEVLFPFFKLAESYGIHGLIQKIPFSFHSNESTNLEDDVFM